VLTQMRAGEREAASVLLATDRWSGIDDLNFTFWPAAFRAADRRSTELLVLPDPVWALAALVDAEGFEVTRDSATGRPLHLVAPSGSYSLLLDAARDGKTGRYRGTIPLPDFSCESPTVSSILIAPGEVPADRDSMAAKAPQGLQMRASQPMRLYAELYNLGRVDGVSRWRAEYRIERLDGSLMRGSNERSLMIAFDREESFAPRHIESVVLDPDRLPRGRYRLQLEIVDHILGVRSTSARIEFRLR